jgi:hypothetical protein
MALTNTLSPVKTVNTLDSDVNAACSQLPYKFEIDVTGVQLTSASAVGSTTKIFTLMSPVPTTSIGDLVVFVDSSGLYTSVYKAIDVTATGITIDTPFQGNITGGASSSWSIIQENHRVELSIYDSTGTYLIIPETISITLNKFSTFFDLKAIIESYLDANNLNEVVYQLQYREAYTGLTPPALTALDNVHAIRAKKQLLKDGGSNIWEYLLREKYVVDFEGGADSNAGNLRLGVDILEGNITASIGSKIYITFLAGQLDYSSGWYDVVESDFTTRTRITVDFPYISAVANGTTMLITSLGKLLTKFENPLTWGGWKRTISALMDSDFATRTGYVAARIWSGGCDINKNFLGSASSISGDFSTVEIKQSTLQDPGSSEKFLRIYVIPSTTTSPELSETIYYKSLEEGRNPLMIEWINSLGAYEQHLFQLNQEFTDEVEDNEIYHTPINDDIETVSKVIAKRSSTYTQYINMVAQGLTLDQLKALKEIKTSNEVRLFLSKDGSSYVNVVVDEGLETVYESDSSEHEYNLTIRLPENFDFDDAKLY